MRRLLAAGTAVAATAVPAQAQLRDHVPGCASAPCDKRIGKRWARKRPKIAKAAVVQPYRAFLAKLRRCEVGGQRDPYRTATGNGFFGAYQFTMSSWAAVGGSGRPDLAPPLEQDYRAVRLLRLQGPGAWPVCSR